MIGPRPTAGPAAQTVLGIAEQRSGGLAADSVRDQRIERIEPLLAPNRLLEELPLSDAQAEVVLGGRTQVHRVLDGEDDRLLVVVGPCSVHDVEATFEYAARLTERAAAL